MREEPCNSCKEDCDVRNKIGLYKVNCKEWHKWFREGLGLKD